MLTRSKLNRSDPLRYGDSTWQSLRPALYQFPFTGISDAPGGTQFRAPPLTLRVRYRTNFLRALTPRVNCPHGTLSVHRLHALVTALPHFFFRFFFFFFQAARELGNLIIRLAFARSVVTNGVEGFFFFLINFLRNDGKEFLMDLRRNLKTQKYTECIVTSAWMVIIVVHLT